MQGVGPPGVVWCGVVVFRYQGPCPRALQSVVGDMCFRTWMECDLERREPRCGCPFFFFFLSFPAMLLLLLLLLVCPDRARDRCGIPELMLEWQGKTSRAFRSV